MISVRQMCIRVIYNTEDLGDLGLIKTKVYIFVLCCSALRTKTNEGNVALLQDRKDDCYLLMARG